MNTARYYIGLMSGTSADGIDAALVQFQDNRPATLNSLSLALPDATRERIIAICLPGENEIDRLGALDRELGELFAEATLKLLAENKLTAKDIFAIGSHGQTIRHRPPEAKRQHPFTLQIADPNIIAQRTGITTVADFRRRDMAAGGHGAPLAPSYHKALFNSEEKTRAIVNIGGIGNATLLRPGLPALGFDTGPGNGLMDAWIGQEKYLRFDDKGKWALSGNINSKLLSELLTHPFLSLPPPKSTGREDFNLAWLKHVLSNAHTTIKAEDVQRTLLEFTALSIKDGLSLSDSTPPQEIYICGGGAQNDALMGLLADKMSESELADTSALGLAPDWVEAVAFAWLAKQTMNRLPGNLPSVTGAESETILGGVYFA